MEWNIHTLSEISNDILSLMNVYVCMYVYKYFVWTDAKRYFQRMRNLGVEYIVVRDVSNYISKCKQNAMGKHRSKNSALKIDCFLEQ